MRLLHKCITGMIRMSLIKDNLCDKTYTEKEIEKLGLEKVKTEGDWLLFKREKEWYLLKEECGKLKIYYKIKI